MNNEWKWQQENARLQSRVKRMLDIIISYDIPEDDDEMDEVVLTKSQTDFIWALELDYGKIYRLAKKYESGFDAIEEVMEAEGYEFDRVI